MFIICNIEIRVPKESKKKIWSKTLSRKILIGVMWKTMGKIVNKKLLIFQKL